MATRMQQRRSPASEWTSVNPILAPGEIGFETDTNKFKFGDGVNHWADLTYFTSSAEIQNLIDGAPDLLNTLNELAASIGDDPAFFTTVATNLSNHESDTTNIHGIADTAELATKTFAANLLTNATKSNITITGDKNGLTITAENGVADSTTDDLTEGSTNKYFTDERAQDAIGNNLGTGLSYNDSTGGIEVNTSVIATKTYADTAASNAAAAVVDSAPSTLNTLNELAAALGDDANYATTVTTALGLKAPLESPALTGTPTAPTATAGTNTTQVSTTAFVKTAIDALKTADIEEQTNLYFTDQRAVDAVVYAINHGLDVTLDGGTL